MDLEAQSTAKIDGVLKNVPKHLVTRITSAAIASDVAKQAYPEGLTISPIMPIAIAKPEAKGWPNIDQDGRVTIEHILPADYSYQQAENICRKLMSSYDTSQLLVLDEGLIYQNIHDFQDRKVTEVYQSLPDDKRISIAQAILLFAKNLGDKGYVWQDQGKNDDNWLATIEGDNIILYPSDINVARIEGVRQASEYAFHNQFSSSGDDGRVYEKVTSLDRCIIFLLPPDMQAEVQDARELPYRQMINRLLEITTTKRDKTAERISSLPQPTPVTQLERRHQKTINLPQKERQNIRRQVVSLQEALAQLQITGQSSNEEIEKLEEQVRTLQQQLVESKAREAYERDQGGIITARALDLLDEQIKTQEQLRNIVS
jgi:hypothetical protein